MTKYSVPSEPENINNPSAPILIQTSASATQAEPFGVRSKVVAGLLAFYGGWFGAHWYYLGRPYAKWLTLAVVACLLLASQAPIWWDTPILFVVFIPAITGFIESLVLCLRSDERFDARYNPGYVRIKHTGWGPVLVAITGLLMGTILTLFAIAHVVLHIWQRMGWLEGLNF
jgi:hypothetical protein